MIGYSHFEVRTQTHGKGFAVGNKVINQMPITLKATDPTLFSLGSSFLCLGKRNSGKSYCTVSLLRSKQFNFQRFCVWCGTPFGRAFWSEALGSDATVKGCDTNGELYMEKLLSGQESLLDGLTDSSEFDISKSGVVMIFDDVTTDRHFCRKTGPFSKMFTQGRHYGITVVVCCQYIKQLPPVVRDNIDFFVLMSISPKTIKVLHSDYFDYPETIEQLKTMLKVVSTQKDENNQPTYACLIYDNCRDRGSNQIFTVYHPEKIHSVADKLGWYQRRYLQRHYKKPDKQRLSSAFSGSNPSKTFSFYIEAPPTRRSESKML